jgi:hypothetical protein
MSLTSRDILAATTVSSTTLLAGHDQPRLKTTLLGRQRKGAHKDLEKTGKRSTSRKGKAAHKNNQARSWTDAETRKRTKKEKTKNQGVDVAPCFEKRVQWPKCCRNQGFAGKKNRTVTADIIYVDSGFARPGMTQDPNVEQEKQTSRTKIKHRTWI